MRRECYSKISSLDIASECGHISLRILAVEMFNKWALARQKIFGKGQSAYIDDWAAKICNLG